MNWKAISKNCMSSEEGYLLSKYALQEGAAYIARTPAGKILHSGKDLAKAKTACTDHLSSQKVAA
ncbi:hypothetical protein [Pseudomonas sp. URMO17WK12:I12]|uniref:hypothetical protein n=1 Tax=Pseudomonas sp. URMO17WK12:I12 TaxID=1259797 RepID=UPI00047F5064|nr:hypothetical protein [Pseudomonas sp. URMO17WK12:I12]